MIIDVVSDAICPWCYIGKRRLERALALAPRPDIKIGWRPFQLNPDMPPEGMDRQAYLKRKFGTRAGGGMYEAVEAAGREEGIAFAFARIARTPNTILAHRLIRHAARADRQEEIVEAIFRVYFLDGLDIGRIEVLASLAEALGMDGGAVKAYLETDQDLAAIKAEDAFARQIGIEGVPCFIIDRKFAISGAQSPETFVRALAEIDRETAPA
ncbi:MAG: DsbA family oxidoreductase [Pseudomonadota bacterium]